MSFMQHVRHRVWVIQLSKGEFAEVFPHIQDPQCRSRELFFHRAREVRDGEVVVDDGVGIAVVRLHLPANGAQPDHVDLGGE